MIMFFKKQRYVIQTYRYERWDSTNWIFSNEWKARKKIGALMSDKYAGDEWRLYDFLDNRVIVRYDKEEVSHNKDTDAWLKEHNATVHKMWYKSYEEKPIDNESN